MVNAWLSWVGIIVLVVVILASWALTFLATAEWLESRIETFREWSILAGAWVLAINSSALLLAICFGRVG